MAVPNLRPEYDDDAADTTVRGGNAALVYRDDDAATDDVRAASARASSLTHRFGGVRYALSRPSPVEPEAPADTDDDPGENA